MLNCHLKQVSGVAPWWLLGDSEGYPRPAAGGERDDILAQTYKLRNGLKFSNLDGINNLIFPEINYGYFNVQKCSVRVGSNDSN